MLRDAVIEKRLNWGHVALCSVAYVAFALSVSFRLYGGGTYDEKTFFYGYSMASSYVGAWVVFVAFCAIGNSSHWRSSAFVGRISYSVYLMHAYVLSVIVYLFGAGSTPLQWLLFAASVTGISILMSWLTFEFVEKPTLAFGRRFRSGSRPGAQIVPPLQNRVAE
ncbi:MAG: acyltransferase family protein [Pseudomonadota bacterium]